MEVDWRMALADDIANRRRLPCEGSRFTVHGSRSRVQGSGVYGLRSAQKSNASSSLSSATRV
eukprot:2477856-Rhodomonas_salina.1